MLRDMNETERHNGSPVSLFDELPAVEEQQVIAAKQARGLAVAGCAGASAAGVRVRVCVSVLIVLPQACSGQKSSSAGRATAITIASSGRPMRQ